MAAAPGRDRRISAGPQSTSHARIVFWEALDPIEQDAFRTVDSARTFTAGFRLIAEGDRADYVIVILSDRTKICVEKRTAASVRMQ